MHFILLLHLLCFLQCTYLLASNNDQNQTNQFPQNKVFQTFIDQQEGFIEEQKAMRRLYQDIAIFLVKLSNTVAEFAEKTQKNEETCLGLVKDLEVLLHNQTLKEKGISGFFRKKSSKKIPKKKSEK